MNHRQNFTRVLLLSMLLLCITGCGKLADLRPALGPTEATTTVETVAETKAPVQTGLIDISDIMKENQTVCYTQLWGNNIFLFYNEEKARGLCSWGMMLYDMETQQVLKNESVEELAQFENSATFYVMDENQILVCNEWEDTGLLYDFDFHTDGVVLHDLYEKFPDYVYNYKEDGLITEGDAENPEEEETFSDEAKNDDEYVGDLPETDTLENVDYPSWDQLSYHPKMPLSVTEQWGTCRGYSQYEPCSVKSAVIFNGHPELVCFADCKRFNNILCSTNDSFMTYVDTMSTSTDPDAWEKPHSFSFEIDRFTTKEKLNAISTMEYSPNCNLDTISSVMNDTYAFLLFSEYNDESSRQYLYLWNYMADSNPVPMTWLEVYTEAELDQKNQNLINQMDKQYHVHIITPYQQDEEQYSLMVHTMKTTSYEMDLNLGKAECYTMLSQINKELSYFPEGFFQECAEGNFDEYSIYLVQRFDDPGVGAFASNMWLNSEITPEEGEEIPMTGQVYICFAAQTFAETHIPHEIMHTMEYRIGEINEGWYALNPETFSYEMDLYNNPEEIDNLDFEQLDYFFSLYATRNELEDRAVTFETLFMDSLSDYPPNWPKEQHLNDKMKFLSDAIRNAFHCVQNSEEVMWEKYLQTDLTQ